MYICIYIYIYICVCMYNMVMSGSTQILTQPLPNSHASGPCGAVEIHLEQSPPYSNNYAKSTRDAWMMEMVAQDSKMSPKKQQTGGTLAKQFHVMCTRPCL